MKNKKTLEIEPIPVPDIRPDDTLGYELFPELYANIFMCAKKKSGKTNAIFEILQHCVNKTTTVFIFSSTNEKDHNWLHIKKWLSDHHINYETFMDIETLDCIVNKLLMPDEIKEKSKDTKDELDLFTRDKVMVKKTPESKPIKKKGPLATEYVFIFDDMSALLRGEAVSCLMKKNRHIKSKVIISSQYPNDLNVPARQMIDYW